MNTRELIILSRNGDKAARDKLVKDNVRLVWSIVRRFDNRGYELEDLFQIGSIGLIKAIDKFDISFDVQFSTYAVPMISGEIKRFLRDNGIVKISRSIKENGWKIRRAKEKIEHEKGKEATLCEISNETGISMEDIVIALEANVEVESINKLDCNQIEMVDKIQDKKDVNEEILNKIVINQLLEALEEQERKLIELRYYKDKTQVETAKELGISQVQVSRLEKKILLRMRKSYNY